MYKALTLNIVNYNKKAVSVAQKIKLIPISIFLIISLIFGIAEELKLRIVTEDEYKYFFDPGALISIFLFYFGFFKIGYHKSKYVVVGKLTIDESQIKIKYDENEILYNKNEYKIEFSDDGVVGKSNWVPFTNIGAMSVESGINTITLINNITSESITYDIFIEYNIQMDVLKEFLRKNTNY
jgi:hypothetical protein